MRLQAYARGTLARRAVDTLRRAERGFLGMVRQLRAGTWYACLEVSVIPAWRRLSCVCCVQEASSDATERLAVQRKLVVVREAAYDRQRNLRAVLQQKQLQLQNRILFVEGPEMMASLQTSIRDWMFQVK